MNASSLYSPLPIEASFVNSFILCIFFLVKLTLIQSSNFWLFQFSLLILILFQFNQTVKNPSDSHR